MKRKSSDRQDAVQKAAALQQSAGPLTHQVTERVQAVAVLVSPYAQLAVDRIGPLARAAGGRAAPLALSTADRVSPYARQAVDRISGSPYAQRAAILLYPYARQAAGSVGPIAQTAKQRGIRVAHVAVDVLGPRIDDAYVRLTPAMRSARETVSEELVVRLNEAVSAAAGHPVVVEVSRRGKATMAAAKGELSLPEPKSTRRRGWLAPVAVAAVAAVTAVVSKRLLDAKILRGQPVTSPTIPQHPAQAAAIPSDLPATAVVDTQGGTAADVPQTLQTEPEQADEFAAPPAGADKGGVSTSDTAANPELPVDAVEPAAQTPVINDKSPAEPAAHGTSDPFDTDQR